MSDAMTSILTDASLRDDQAVETLLMSEGNEAMAWNGLWEI